MKNKLIIFTQEFPFKRGEPFLEVELPYLEKKFDEILIIATSLHKGERQTRDIAGCVEIYPIDRPDGKKKLLYGICNGLLNINSQVVRELKRYHLLKEKIAVLYYTGKYKSVFKKASDRIMSFIGNESDVGKVVLYSYWFIETAEVAITLANRIRNKGIPCAVCSRAHGFDLYSERNPAGNFPFRERVLEEIDSVYPCSQNGTDYLSNLYPEYTKKFKKRYLGTLDNGLNPLNQEKIFTIVTCSNLLPVKRLSLLANALQKLDGEKLNIVWFCIGDGPEREHLTQITNQFKHIKVQFLGAMKNAEVLKWYRENHIDLFVNTSSSEGLPVSIMEACSFGIPVMATEVGGTSEIVENGHNGILLQAVLTADNLAKHIKEFYFLSSDQKEEYRSGARKIWEQSFDAEKNYRDFSEELLNL